MYQETTLLSALRVWPLYAPNKEKLQTQFHFVAALIFLLQRGGGVTGRWGGEEGGEGSRNVNMFGPVDLTLF